MSIRELVENKLKVFASSLASSRSKLLKMVGGVKIKIDVKNSGECFRVFLTSESFSTEECEQNKCDILIEGKDFVLEKLVKTVDPSVYKKFETRGELKVKPKSLKGKLILSRVKKMFNL